MAKRTPRTEEPTESGAETPAPEAPAQGEEVPQPERRGPQHERQHRAEYHVRAGVEQLLRAKRSGGTDAAFIDLATQLLRRAYGLPSRTVPRREETTE